MENEKSVLAIDDIYQSLNNLCGCIGEMHSRMCQVHDALIGVSPMNELGDKTILTLEDHGYYALLKDKIIDCTEMVQGVLVMLKDF